MSMIKEEIIFVNVVLMVLLGLLGLWLFVKFSTYFDYFVVGLMTWYLTSQVLEIHNAFVLVIVLAAIALWWFLCNITVFGYKVFRILGALFAATLITAIFVTELPIDIEWRIVIGVATFVGIMAIRIAKSDLLERN